MTKIILLDSTPVGLITNPKSTSLAIECQQWLQSLFDRGYHVVLPEIIDYEIRRELLRANRLKGIRRLNLLKSELNLSTHYHRSNAQSRRVVGASQTTG
jgi:hypothetical protein